MKKLCFLSKCQKTTSFLIVTGILLLSVNQQDVIAVDDPPDRTITSQIESTLYEWWLVYWSDNSVACDFFIEHDGNPTDQEIKEKCSMQLYQNWFNSPPCDNSTNSYSKKCSGLYLHLANTTPVQKEVEIKFGLPVVRLSLSGCEYQGNLNYCTGTPSLTFSGLEPMPDEKILKIHWKIGGASFNCEKSECVVPLPTTKLSGMKITFQADSSFGDSSIEYTAYARVIPVNNQHQSYYIDVISTQWDGRPPPPCSNTWQVFPEETFAPEWLSTPRESAEIFFHHKPIPIMVHHL